NNAEIFGPGEVAARFELPEATAGPAYADMATLRGDPSDGLPGVPGVGDKTAAKLITRFGSLESLLAAATEGSSDLTPKTRSRLSEAAEYLAAAPRVVRVVTDAPVTLSKDDHLPTTVPDPARIAELAERWNLGGA